MRSRVRLVTTAFMLGLAATSLAEDGSSVHDLLEVVDDEQHLPVREVRDQALLEVALGVEEPERTRDGADDETRVAHRLERHDDDAVRELVGRRRGDLLGQTRLPDPSGTGDRQQPNVVPVQERRRVGEALLAPDRAVAVIRR